MFDETNQNVEGFEAEELPKNIFGDEDEDTGVEFDSTFENAEEGAGEDSANAEEENATAEGENHAENDAETDTAKIRIKYNGEERDISLDEARTLAQKGMNYDHVVEEMDRNRKAFDYLSAKAKEDGLTIEQLIERESQRAEDQRLEERISKIRERDEDASEETIEQMAKLELEAERNRIERERQAAERTKVEEARNKEIEGWAKLFEKHPELIGPDGRGNISNDVRELIKQGATPIEAYYATKLKEMETQSRIKEDAEKAKNKSIGSLSGDRATEKDDFLDGFLS